MHDERADALDSVRAEIDALVARQQRPEHSVAVDRLFAMSGAEPGQAAVWAAQRDRRGREQPQRDR